MPVACLSSCSDQTALDPACVYDSDVDETWTKRDLPVLEAIVKFLDEKAGAETPEGSDIAERLQMDIDDVARALIALDGEFIEVRWTAGGPASSDVLSVTASARRVVGQWPTAERAVDQLINELEKSAALEADPERKKRLRSAASTIKDLARDLTTEVMAKVIAGALGV